MVSDPIWCRLPWSMSLNSKAWEKSESSPPLATGDFPGSVKYARASRYFAPAVAKTGVRVRIVPVSEMSPLKNFGSKQCLTYRPVMSMQ